MPYMTWEDLQGIPLEQQLDDVAADYRSMSAMLEQAVSDPEAFLELCKQARKQATEALSAGDQDLGSNWEWDAEHFPSLKALVRLFTLHRLQEEGL